jgi:hypothetical protein
MQEERQDGAGIGDPRELPQKLRTTLGNRFISDTLPSLGWGALLLRALGFRMPTVEEVRQLESYVEVNSDQEGISGGEFARVMGVDITVVKSSGAREEYKSQDPSAAKIEIFAMLKNKTYVAVIPSEARQGTVKGYIRTLGTKPLRAQTPEDEVEGQRETEVASKKRKEPDNLILIPDDDNGEQYRGKKMTLMQKIPILAEISEEAFKNFSTEVQQYQSEWGWTNSIAFDIKKKVEKLWNMGQGVKWIEADKETKVEFLSGLQEVIKRAAGQFRSERIMIEDPVLRWSEGSIDWEDLE